MRPQLVFRVNRLALLRKFDMSFLQYLSNNIEGVFRPLIAVVGAPDFEQVPGVVLAEVDVYRFAKIIANRYLLALSAKNLVS